VGRAAAMSELSAQVRGQVLGPQDPDYDAARSVWNAMIDRRPAVIVRSRGVADVMTAVRFARQHDLEISVRGGGHNVAGRAVTEGGMMIDASPMRGVRVDLRRRVVQVQAGALLGDVDHETQAHGLVTPAGVMSETGVAGLALGGGWGWLSRRLGMTVDNLVAAELVTAEGTLVRVDDDEHPELAWGLRGGGGNFGIVTSFEFALHQVGPSVLAGPLLFDVSAAAEVLRGWRELMAEAPDELGSIAGFSLLGDTPAVDAELRGRTVLSLMMVWSGDHDEGQQVLRPLRDRVPPLADLVGPMRYTALQSAGDAKQRDGHRVYVTSNYLAALPDAAIDTIVAHVDPMPTPWSSAGLIAMGGAINRVPVEATAFPHRQTAFEFDISPKWEHAADDERHLAWARAFNEAVAPYVTGGVYGNVPSAERARDAYGRNFDRLARLKADWDPDNVFHLNQNVPPCR
jgi:FAD/FMN-containing dehydrogenase